MIVRSTVTVCMLIASTIHAQQEFDFSQTQYSPSSLPADILTLIGRSLQPVDAQPWPQLQSSLRADQPITDVPLAGVLRNLLTPQQNTPQRPAHLRLKSVPRTPPTSPFLPDSGSQSADNLAQLLQLITPPSLPPRALTDEQVMVQGLDIVTRGLLGASGNAAPSDGVVSTLVQLYKDEEARKAAKVRQSIIPPQLAAPSAVVTNTFGNPGDLLSRFTPDQRQLLQNLRRADQISAVSSNSIETRHLRNNQILRELQQRGSRTPIAFGATIPPTTSARPPIPFFTPPPAPSLVPQLQTAFVAAAAPAIGDLLTALANGAQKPLPRHIADSPVSNLRKAHLSNNRWKQILEPYLVETRPTTAKRFARDQRRAQVKRDFDKKYALPERSAVVDTQTSLFRNPVRVSTNGDQLADDFFRTNQIDASFTTESPLVRTGLQFVANLFKNGPSEEVAIDTGDNFDRFLVHKTSKVNTFGLPISDRFESQGLYWGDGDVKVVNEKGKRVLGQMAGYENGGFVLPINAFFPKDNSPLRRQFVRS